MGGSSPWTRPSAPGCGDSLKAPAGGDRLEDDSGVAIDWVTGWSYSSAQRRLNVRCGSQLERSRPWSWTLKRCCGKRMDPCKAIAIKRTRVERWSLLGAPRNRAEAGEVPEDHKRISITNDGSKGHGYHIQTARVRRTSSWRSICWNSGKHGRCSKNYWKLQNRNVQTYGFVYHDTNGQNHGPVWKTQSFLLNEICMVILWQDCYGKDNLRKSFWSAVGRRFPNWECLFVKKQNIFPMWKVLNKEVDLGETNIFPWSCILGMYSKTMWNKQRYCGQLQNHVRIANFSGRSREITIPSKSSYFSMVLWHGWSCKEVCGTILWVGKQDDSTTLQSIYSMHRWPPLQRRRNKICWRIVEYMLSNCSEMLILGKNWTTWCFIVSE